MEEDEVTDVIVETVPETVEEAVVIVQDKEERVTFNIFKPPENEEDVRLVLKQEVKEEEEGPIHGFLGNRTVFLQKEVDQRKPCSEAHLNFLRGFLVDSLKYSDSSDLTLVLADGEIFLNRLVAFLVFPVLGSCSLEDTELLLLPNHTVSDFHRYLNVFFGDSVSLGDSTARGEVIEVNFLSLDPLPLDRVHMKKERVEAGGGENIQEENQEEEKESKTKMLKCQVCREQFPNMYSLVTHEVENHELEQGRDPSLTEFDPVQCFRCKTVMTRASDLSDHTCTHTKYNPTKCSSCRRILANRGQMTSHSCPQPQPLPGVPSSTHNSFDWINRLSCGSCGAVFPTVRRTVIHEVEECNNTTRKDHPDFRLKIFNCQHCDRNFVIKKKFNLHMERHRKEAEPELPVNVTESSPVGTECIVMPEPPVVVQYGDEANYKDSGGVPIDVIITEGGKQETINDLENIDPQGAADIGDDIENEATKSEKEVKQKEVDFLKAVKQLQELEKGPSNCRHCGKRMSSKKAMLEHEVNVHGDMTHAEHYYRCDFCPKIFLTEGLRANHMTRHTDERRFQCHLCALRFKTTGNLTAHLGSCHDPTETGLFKRFNCKFCSKTFRFPAQIQQHERVHTKEKPFHCQHCGKGFSVKCNLKAHMETHKSVNERSFKCEVCDHSATTLPLLKLHMNSHTGERPFVCELCGDSYKRPSNLRRHKKTMCKLRPGAPPDEEEDEMEEGVYERIETVVVQDGDEGEIIIETEEYEFLEEGVVIESMPGVLIDSIGVDSVVDTVVEEGIVEDDGIKYETQLVSL